MKLLIDLGQVRIPPALARVVVVNTPFAQFPADYHNQADVCPRCNRLLAEHWWQLVDPDESEQGGVIDCAGVNW